MNPLCRRAIYWWWKRVLFLDCNGEFSLARLRTGETAELVRLEQGCGMRRRLLDMGLIPRTRVTLQKIAPMGDPIEIRVRGYELTLRVEEAEKIEVKEDA